MNELYWITRLDVINNMSVVLFVVCGLVSVLIYIAANTFDAADDEDERKAHSVFRTLLPITIVSLLLMVFVPTKEDALLIYGVGGTIDYIKSNDTAKQIPAKVIKACDMWISKLVEEETK